jgi:hypothetical protein
VPAPLRHGFDSFLVGVSLWFEKWDVRSPNIILTARGYFVLFADSASDRELLGQRVLLLKPLFNRAAGIRLS